MVRWMHFVCKSNNWNTSKHPCDGSCYMATWLGQKMPRLNIIYGCVIIYGLRVFPGEISTGISGLSKTESLPQSRWASSKSLEGLNRTKSRRRKNSSPPLFKICLTHCLNWTEPSHLLPSDWDLHHQCHWFSGCWTPTKEILHWPSWVSSP